MSTTGLNRTVTEKKRAQLSEVVVVIVFVVDEPSDRVFLSTNAED